MPVSVPQGFRVGSGTPIDDRYVCDSLAQAKSSIKKVRRYRGLKIFSKEDGKEYWFRDGIADSNLVPYQPNNMYVVHSYNELYEIPIVYRYEGLEVIMIIQSTPTKMILVGGTTNECWHTWNEFISGSGGQGASLPSTIQDITYEEMIEGNSFQSEFDLEHGLGVKYVDYSVYDTEDNQVVVNAKCIQENTNNNYLRVIFDTPPEIGEDYHVIVRR